MKGQSVTSFKINGRKNYIYMTEHSLKRLKDRNISKNVVLSHILDLTKEEFLFYQENQADLALVVINENLVIICSFNGNYLNVVTEILFEKTFYFKDDFVKFIK